MTRIFREIRAARARMLRRVVAAWGWGRIKWS